MIISNCKTYVDEGKDISDVISSLKHKGNWDWKLEDAQTFLAHRFPQDKVQDVLCLNEQDYKWLLLMH